MLTQYKGSFGQNYTNQFPKGQKSPQMDPSLPSPTTCMSVVNNHANHPCGPKIPARVGIKLGGQTIILQVEKDHITTNFSPRILITSIEA